MNRYLSTSVASVVLLLAATVQPAAAQAYNYSPYSRPGFGPYTRPTVSPYLNLLRGSNTAANYYLGVLPEFQRRYDALQYGAAIQDLERRSVPRPQEEDLLPTLPETGHGAAFNNTLQYFPVPGQGVSALGTGPRPASRSGR
jgi:hypothetical protein